MKKILIGTHNKGKFKEIAHLLSKKYKKISPDTLKIPSPKETSKTFVGNSELKANFFSKFVDYPVISDDSGLCIKSLNNKPGIFSARLAKRKGSFFKAMNYILKKMKKIDQHILFAPFHLKINKKKWLLKLERYMEKLHKKYLGKEASVMIQYLFQKTIKSLLVKWYILKS